MKLIIDINDNEYIGIKEYPNNITSYPVTIHIYDAIRKGTSLDDVNAKISEKICLTDNPYTKETKYTIEHLELLEILDNIGKADNNSLLISMAEALNDICEQECCAYGYESLLDIVDEILEKNK